MAEVTVDQALSERAAVGAQPRVFHASTPEGDLVLGAVLGPESGRLLVLRRNAAGRYDVEAASAPFRNDFGIGYDLEIVEYNGKGRFSMDVAAHSACGVRVDLPLLPRVRAVACPAMTAKILTCRVAT